jgi:hypothetical protein
MGWQIERKLLIRHFPGPDRVGDERHLGDVHFYNANLVRGPPRRHDA